MFFLLDKKTLPVHELIGLRVAVVRSSVKHLAGFSGIVVDESKNTFVFEKEGGVEKRIPKKACVFEFVLPNGERAAVEGETIAFAPEERPKKLWKTIREKE